MGELFDRLSSNERLSVWHGRAARAASSVGRASLVRDDGWDGVIDQLNIPEDLSDLGKYLRIGRLVTRTKATLTAKRTNDSTDPRIFGSVESVDTRLNGYRLTPRWRGRGMSPIFVGIADLSMSPRNADRDFSPEHPGGQSLLAAGYLLADTINEKRRINGGLFNPGPGYSPIAVPNILDGNSMEQAREFIQDSLFQIGQQMQARLG